MSSFDRTQLVVDQRACRILIQVASVNCADAPLPEVCFKDGVEALTNRRPRADERRLDPRLTRPVEACSRYHGQLVAGVHFHPVVAATHLAFHDHRPLVLSPDIIWLLIAQGFANHVNANAENLRRHLVRHAGKLSVEVRRNDFIKGSPENPWCEIFEEFTDQVRGHIGEVIRDLLLPTFSTTGPVERTATQIVLLDALQSYFSFVCHSACGIPQIVLEGTPNDWQTLAERAAGLAHFGLQWWTVWLMPILREFVDAAKGKVNQDFWQSIYKREEVSGGHWITGWLTTFFPYLKDFQTGQPARRNPLLDPKVDQHRSLMGWGPSTDAFPSGLARAPFFWHYHDRTFDMEFLGGFVGVVQDAATLQLRPEIGWAVRDLALIRCVDRATELAAADRHAELAKARAQRVAQVEAECAREREKRAKATVAAPPLDPRKPRHEQFFQLTCPFCGHQEEIGLWFPYKTCSQCKKGINIARRS
jgi:hypothetical protein